MCEVPAGDRTQVTIVADHVEWMVTFLVAHHEGKDRLVWPGPLEHIPAKIDPVGARNAARPDDLPVRSRTCPSMIQRWR